MAHCTTNIGTTIDQHDQLVHAEVVAFAINVLGQLLTTVGVPEEELVHENEDETRRHHAKDLDQNLLQLDRVQVEGAQVDSTVREGAEDAADELRADVQQPLQSRDDDLGERDRSRAPRPDSGGRQNRN